MGVYINMEMPIDGNETIIRIQPDGTILDQYGHHLAITAVPVPPHFGDLIDRAMLIDSFEPSDFWNSSAEDNCFAAIHVTNSMPAIIPAEEKS